METYYINDNLRIEAEYFETRYNWGHKARAIYHGREVADTKIVYQNRTWESYKFQSVMQKLIDLMDEEKIIPLADRYQASRMIKTGDGREMRGLRTIGAVAMMGSLLFKKLEEQNVFKAKVIGDIDGIIMPDDFESLSEAEKSSRLDGAINILTTK